MHSAIQDNTLPMPTGSTPVDTKSCTHPSHDCEHYGYTNMWVRLSDEQRRTLAASFIQQRHTVASIGAAIAGAGILLARKGTQPHRIMGRIWTGVAVIASLHTFRLRDAQGNFTWFHGLSTLTLTSAATGVYFARTKKIAKHKKLMGVAYVSAALAGIAVWATPGKKTAYTPVAWRPPLTPT